MASVIQVLERITALAHEHEINKDLYQLLSQFLTWLIQQEQVPVHVLPYIQIRCMSCSGIELQFELTKMAKHSRIYIYRAGCLVRYLLKQERKI